MEAIFFLLNTVIGFFTALFLLRFMMQLARVSFAGQIGDFIVRLTNWAVKPLRRLIPGFAGIDWASLLAALALQTLLAGLIVGVSGDPLGDVPGAGLIILQFAVHGLLRLTVYILIVAVIALALLSWVNPYSPVASLAHQLTRPLLDPIRRIVPTISGIDLSPLVVILLLQVVLIYL
ncbi:YggT family protein [Azonexus sp.]|jgi:YggT family protein|uniref:YggT family protein n=1 Tax=Azonexus sp. TaxID=1872668 RepID=UPI0028391C3E|nr:YggT family protein [Azonexus sp.]MDR1995782.1 YggT family protein [Azonexus sp.]